FGNRRIIVCSQLPDAYRSAPRPSSPVHAKASTKCSYLTLEIPHYLRQACIIANDLKGADSNLRKITFDNVEIHRSDLAIAPMHRGIDINPFTMTKTRGEAPLPACAGSGFQSLECLVEPVGIEPTTSSLQS